VVVSNVNYIYKSKFWLSNRCCMLTLFLDNVSLGCCKNGIFVEAIRNLNLKKKSFVK